MEQSLEMTRSFSLTCTFLKQDGWNKLIQYSLNEINTQESAEKTTVPRKFKYAMYCSQNETKMNTCMNISKINDQILKRVCGSQLSAFQYFYKIIYGEEH